MLKKCSRCGIEKELSEFYKDKKTSDGTHSWCKSCHNLYRKLGGVLKNNLEDLRRRKYTLEKKIALSKKLQITGKYSGMHSCAIALYNHHEDLKDDPERLTTEFIAKLSNCSCERRYEK